MNPQVSMQDMAAAQSAHVESMQSLASAALKATERLLALNLGMVRTTLEASTGSLKAGTLTHWQDMFNHHQSALQKVTEGMTSYVRSVSEITAETQAETAGLVSAHMDKVNESMISGLDKLVQGGSVGTVTIAKDMIARKTGG
jgi:phasin family protein